MIHDYAKLSRCSELVGDVSAAPCITVDLCILVLALRAGPASVFAGL